jgi:hypothetical protein
MGGDCSLWVRAATIEYDDGQWECQVTASDFTAQDALTSQPAKLVVRGNFHLHLHSLPINMHNYFFVFFSSFFIAQWRPNDQDSSTKACTYHPGIMSPWTRAQWQL